MKPLRSRVARVLGVALALGLVLAPAAEARRGGSFGSRGMRTYSAPRSTATAPGYVPPVQRSMTPGSAARPGYGAYAPASGYNGYNNNAFRRPGFGGGFLGGLVTGGIIGGLMGHGWGWGGGYGGMGGGWGGGGGGFLAVIIQLAILFFVVSLVMRIFRRRSAGYSPFAAFQGPQPAYGGFGGGTGFGGSGFGASTAVPPTGPAWEFDITPQDRDAFERLLHDVQDAFGREDYGALREHTTPEVMSYLAEELSDNATHGRRNEVSGTKLLQADVGEAWREGPTDYATAAMRYESIDLMRDRTTGAVLSGDPNTPSQTTELWTFARNTGGPWKLSAIQQA